jgi:hypothetical protein
MNKKVLKLFEQVCEVNDQMIQTTKVIPMAIIIYENKPASIIGMVFRDGLQKIKMRNGLKKLIAEQDCKAYILIMDTLMTTIDQKTKKHEVKDAIIRQLYTPKEKIMEAVFYKDRQILEKKRFTDDETMVFASEWDLWNTTPFDDFIV